MRDGGPERAVRSTHGVDMDPLRVVGGSRELVDPLLRDLEPLGRAELLADQVCKAAHRASSSPLRSGRLQRTTLAAHV